MYNIQSSAKGNKQIAKNNKLVYLVLFLIKLNHALSGINESVHVFCYIMHIRGVSVRIPMLFRFRCKHKIIPLVKIVITVNLEKFSFNTNNKILL